MPDQAPKPPVTPTVGAPGEPRAVAAAPRTAETWEPNESECESILSPLVGTCCLQPRPGDPPFVKVGDVVERGRTVCLIEAMMLLNEVKAELNCMIEEFLVTSGQPVELGTKLFRVRSL